MKNRFLLIFYLSFLLLPLIPDQILDVEQMSEQWIEVSVKGAVAEPETVRCPVYTRIEDVLKEVEVLPQADLSVYSMNTVLKDGDVLDIPVKQQQERISINTATLQQLCEIPGVGESTAQKIIDFRKKQGLFQSLEDLMKIPGIKQKKWEGMKEYIRL